MRSIVVTVVIGVLISASASVAIAASSSTDTSRLRLGDGRVSLTPKRGYITVCSLNTVPATQLSSPWINSRRGVFNEQAKPVVDGQIRWNHASIAFKSLKGGRLQVSGNGLPRNLPTGSFPVDAASAAYTYNQGKTAITKQSVNGILPKPVPATRPSCLGTSVIGITTNGVALMTSVDVSHRDRVAHEVSDSCSGNVLEGSGLYYYTQMPLCWLQRQSRHKASSIVGYAFDGYPITGPRGPGGKWMTNKDLDACHGTVSSIRYRGHTVRMYHYTMTLEFPYTVGCYHGQSRPLKIVSSITPPPTTGGGGQKPPVVTPPVTPPAT